MIVNLLANIVFLLVMLVVASFMYELWRSV